MRINTRFAVAVHTMAVIALLNMGYLGTVPTSGIIAYSIDTHPVVVRRIIGMLKWAGLVDTRTGVGGSELTRAPEDITLLDVYRAVRPPDDAALFDLHRDPNPAGFIGARIREALDNPFSEAQKAMEDNLSTRTLKDVLTVIAERNHFTLL